MTRDLTDDYRVGKVINQDGHGLFIRFPLECVDYEEASDRRGSGDNGGGINDGVTAGFVSEDPPTLANEGTRNNSITTACGRCRM